MLYEVITTVWAALLEMSAEVEAECARAIGPGEMAELRALLTRLGDARGAYAALV